MDASGDDAADFRRLQERLDDYIDANPPGWTDSQRNPCVSAVWDRTSGRVYYNHNVNEAPRRSDFDPALRGRFDDYANRNDGSGWKSDLEPGQERHGVPGRHSEVRATNEALKDARAEGRDPRLDEFMAASASPVDKLKMPCCGNCTQMIDGVKGSSSGWSTDGHGNKTKNNRSWDGSL
ncbi:hypothetical protein LO763_15545 [Glycomyces sp. A-F 0318]|uniref:YwqJ-related putative deaminase n=1 Tax=Glycomyces amatae TaxID=2881355 RepID=UPI001E4E4227|nr:YwqJ-related putative deaminase [Glycomyces amatae]MCD0445030.1 hypothetical protein [Glycomyces amatae]